ncbi:MAG: hypothetical protein V7754_19965 [Halioglobus sp.]
MKNATPRLLPRWLKASLLGLTSLFLVVTLVAVSAYVLLRNDPRRLEVVLETVVSRVLDRELVIGELLESELSWDTFLRARDVSLSNPAWAEVADFVRVGELELRINLPSIWREGPILIKTLLLSDARVALLAPEGQAPNWIFWPGDDEEPGLEVGPEEGPEPVFPVMFGEAMIDGGELIYRDPDRDILLSIQELQLRETVGEELLDLKLDGSIGDLPLQAKAQIGPTSALLTRRDLAMDLEASLGKLSLELKGNIADLTDFSGSDLHLQVAAPRSRPLLEILGVPEIRDGPLQFSSHITDHGEGIAIDARGALAEFNLSVVGTFDDLPGFDGLDLKFKLGGPSVAELGALFDLEGLSAIPYEASGELHRADGVLDLRKGLLKVGPGRLAMAARLPNFPDIDDWHVTLDGQGFNLAMIGPLIGADDLPALPYDIQGRLESSDEGVELMDFRVQSPDANLVLNGVVGEAPGYLNSSMTVKLSGTNLASTGLWLGVYDLPALAFQVTAELALDDGGWRLSDGVFYTPGLQLDVSGTIDQLPGPSDVQVKLVANSPDLAATLKVYGFEMEGLPAYPAAVHGGVSGPPGNLTIDELYAESGDSQLSLSGELGDPLNLEVLDLAVVFKTPDLLKLLPPMDDEVLPALAVDASGRFAMSPEVFEIRALRGVIGGADISLDGQMTRQDALDKSHILLTTQGPNLNTIVGPWLDTDIPDAPFTLSIDADFQGGGMRIERLEARLADTLLSAEFDITDLEGLSNAQGEIAFSGPSSLALLKLFDAETAIPDSPYLLKAKITRDPDWLRLSPISLDWGKSDYAGSVDIRFDDIPIINADLHSQYVSLPFLLPNMKELEEQEATRQTETPEENAVSEMLTSKELAERVIPDKPLDFSWMRAIEGSLKYRADEIHLNENAKSMAVIDVSLRDGVLSSRRLSWDGSFADGEGLVTLKALDEGVEADIYLDIQRIPLMLFLGGEPDNKPGSLYRVKLSTAGGSLREMAQSANGALLFHGSGGSLDNKGLDLILGDFLEEFLSRLNPFADTDPATQIVCHAGGMHIVDGKVRVDPGLVVRTDKLDMAAGGKVDLHREKLDLAFNTRSRKGLGISASKAITPYFKLGGTLANPRMAIDVKGAAVSGGAAVATAGLSIVAEGLWDRWVATSSNPCESLVEEISGKSHQTLKELSDTPVISHSPSD